MLQHLKTAGVLWAAAWSTALLAEAASPEAPASVQAVLDCAAANAPDRTLSQHLELVTTDATGATQTLRTRVHLLRESEGLKINLKIIAPANLAGMAFLIREQAGQDDMRIFVPALNRVRRVTGNMAARDLWGTSFSYADLKQMFGAFVGGEREWLESGVRAEQAVDIVRILPGAEQSVPFHALTAAIARTTCVPLVIEFLDADAAPIKLLQANPESITTFADRHVALEYTMQDRLSGVATVARFSELRLDESIGAGAFDPRGFADTP